MWIFHEKLCFRYKYDFNKFRVLFLVYISISLFNKKMPGWYSEWRVSWSQDNACGKNGQHTLHIFINIVHFLIFADKSWFKAANLSRFMCIFKSGFAANRCFESSKLTIKVGRFFRINMWIRSLFLTARLLWTVKNLTNFIIRVGWLWDFCEYTRYRRLNSHLHFLMVLTANGASWTLYPTNEVR